jgi:hypothetical protein
MRVDNLDSHVQLYSQVNVGGRVKLRDQLPYICGRALFHLLPSRKKMYRGRRWLVARGTQQFSQVVTQSNIGFGVKVKIIII